MNLSTIIKQINRDVDDSYSNADITDWCNRCLDDLTPYVQKQAKKTYTIDSTNSYDLPTDFYRLVDVVQNSYPLSNIPMNDFDSNGYKVWADAISLQNGPDSGTFDLYYYRKLNRLVNPTDIPEIAEPFHDLFILYALGNIQWMDEDYEQRPDALNRYNQRKQQYIDYISSKYGNPYRIETIFNI